MYQAGVKNRTEMTDTLRIDFVSLSGKRGVSVFNLDEICSYHILYCPKVQRTPEHYKVVVRVKPQEKEECAPFEYPNFSTFEDACAALSLSRDNP